MEFSFFAAGITALYMVFEGAASFFEGTFSRKQKRVRLSFLWHWGLVVGDLILLPIFNGIIVPILSFTLWYLLYFAAATIITVLMHKIWWHSDFGSPIFPNKKEADSSVPSWYKDMGIVGWMHLVFMSGQVTIIEGYIFSSFATKEMTTIIFVIFLAFIPVSVLEPYFIQNRGSASRAKTKETIAVFAAQIFLLCAVAWWKL